MFLSNICQYKSCGLKFPTSDQLIQHMQAAHINGNPEMMKLLEEENPVAVPLSFILPYKPVKIAKNFITSIDGRIIENPITVFRQMAAGHWNESTAEDSNLFEEENEILSANEFPSFQASNFNNEDAANENIQRPYEQSDFDWSGFQREDVPKPMVALLDVNKIEKEMKVETKKPCLETIEKENKQSDNATIKDEKGTKLQENLRPFKPSNFDWTAFEKMEVTKPMVDKVNIFEKSASDMYKIQKKKELETKQSIIETIDKEQKKSEVKEDAVEMKTEITCFCGRLFNTARGLNMHQRMSHENRGKKNSKKAENKPNPPVATRTRNATDASEITQLPTRYCNRPKETAKPSTADSRINGNGE